MIFHRYVKQPDGNPTWCPSSIAKMVQISPISLWLLLVIYHDISIVFMGIMKAIKKLEGHHLVLIPFTTRLTKPTTTKWDEWLMNHYHPQRGVSIAASRARCLTMGQWTLACASQPRTGGQGSRVGEMKSNQPSTVDILYTRTHTRAC